METSQPMDTKDFADKMDRLADAVTKLTFEASEKRHTANGAVNAVVLALQEGQELQADRIGVLEKTAKETTETLELVRNLSTRLIGNAEMKTEGLVHEVEKIGMRVERVEEKATRTDTKLGRLMFAGTAVVAAFTMAGGLITWMITSRFWLLFSAAAANTTP
jgi:hypothetical protein